ncbi:MAG: hypothetical protein GC178_16565 [Flavobacteriales bacterium]|nr:hypothetical protein [Flavobacteriales bacterium]
MDELNSEELEAEGINEVEYAAGFNWGYVIAEHNEELARELMGSIEKDSDRAEGLFHGFNQFFREKEQSRANELSELRNRGKGQERDVER